MQAVQEAGVFGSAQAEPLPLELEPDPDPELDPEPEPDPEPDPDADPDPDPDEDPEPLPELASTVAPLEAPLDPSWLLDASPFAPSADASPAFSRVSSAPAQWAQRLTTAARTRPDQEHARIGTACALPSAVSIRDPLGSPFRRRSEPRTRRGLRGSDPISPPRVRRAPRRGDGRSRGQARYRFRWPPVARTG